MKEKQNKNLSSLKMVLWNSGSENIDQQIKIVLPDGMNIQDAQVVSTTNPLNNVKIKVDPVSKNTAIINFDYLAMKEGCLISLSHTESMESRNQSLPKDLSIKPETKLEQ
ncbi:MAG: hypothetical protein ACMUIM_01505 [bacterium]